MSQFTRSTIGAEVVKEYGHRVKGKTIAITGTSNGGLGAETAIALAHAGPAHILLLARSANKVEPVQANIQGINATTKTTFVPIELDDWDSVRKAAANINDKVSQIDLLINNAGIMAVPYTLNKAGIESHFATNHLGHFLLTALLFDKIAAAGPGARIVNVTSDGYQLGPCRFEDYNFKNGEEYHPWSGYGQSKTANILFTRQLASNLRSSNIYSFAVHPGVISSTSLSNNMDRELFKEANEVALRETGRPFTVGEMKDIEHGISTQLVAALDPRLEDDTGAYMEDCAVKTARDYATSLENAERLWRLSEKLVGQDFHLQG